MRGLTTLETGTVPADAAESYRHAPASTGQIAIGVGWLAAARLATMLISVGTAAILARQLAPADFGTLVLVVMVANLSAAVVEGGIALPLVQRPEIGPNHVHMALGLAMLIAVGLAILATLGAIWAPALVGTPPWPILLATVVAMPLRASIPVFSAVLQREGRFRQSTLIALLSSVLGNALPAVTLAVAGFGVYALIAGFLISSLLEVVLTARAARLPVWTRPPAALARDFRSAGFAGSIMQVANWAALGSTNIIVGMVFGSGPLGIFSRGAVLVNLAKDVLGSSLSRVLLPAFSRLHHTPSRQRRAFERALGMGLPAFSITSVLMILHAEAIILVILGERWRDAVPILQLLAAGLLPRIGYKITDSLTMARGDLWEVARRQCLYLTLLVGSAFAAVPFGLSGVAIGVTAGTTAYYVLSLRAAARAAGSDWRTLFFLHFASAAWALGVGLIDIAGITLGSWLGFWPGQVAGAGASGLTVAVALLWGPKALIGADFSTFRDLVWVKCGFPTAVKR